MVALKHSVNRFTAHWRGIGQVQPVLDDSPFAGATSLADLKDAKVGAQVGTTSLEATDQLDLATGALVYDDTSKAAQALQNGQIDATIADIPTAFYLLAAELDGATLVGQREPRTGESEEFDLLRRFGIDPVSYDDGLVDRIQKAAPEGSTAVLDTVADHPAIAEYSVRGIGGRGAGLEELSEIAAQIARGRSWCRSTPSTRSRTSARPTRARSPGTPLARSWWCPTSSAGIAPSEDCHGCGTQVSIP